MANKEERNMFELVNIGKRIADARRAKGMTQMALADALRISYQAVSSWETGRTMPDISKLPEISAILDISVDELLGKEAPAVQAALTNVTEVTLTPEDIAEAAPILPDNRVAEMVETQMGTDVMELDYDAVEPLLSYLDEDNCGKIFRKLYEKGDYAKMAKMIDYVSEDDIAKVARDAYLKDGITAIKPLLDYLDEDGIDKIAWDAYQKGGVPAIGPMLEYMIDGEDIGKIAWDAYQKGGTSAIVPMLDYMVDGDDIGKIAWDAYRKGGVPAIVPMLDYLDEDDITKIAVDAAKRYGIPAITPLLDYVDEDFIARTIRKAYGI